MFEIVHVHKGKLHPSTSLQRTLMQTVSNTSLSRQRLSCHLKNVFGQDLAGFKPNFVEVFLVLEVYELPAHRVLAWHCSYGVPASPAKRRKTVERTQGDQNVKVLAQVGTVETVEMSKPATDRTRQSGSSSEKTAKVQKQAGDRKKGLLNPHMKKTRASWAKGSWVSGLWSSRAWALVSVGL